MTPELIRRIAAGRTDLVVDYLLAGGDAEFHGADGVSLIQWCAYYGDLSAVRLLLSRGESLGHLGHDLGLNAAAFHGYWRLCQFLLENGASACSALPETGESPLHSALCSDDRVAFDPIIKVLVAAGADVNAATLADQPTGSFMRDSRTRGERPLHRAAAFGTEETIQLLLAAGAKVDARDLHGDTALAWASWYRRPTPILRLLSFGTNVIHPQHQPLRANLMGDCEAAARR